MCMNCVGSCPHGALQFRFFRKEREVASPDIGRRRALTGLAAGAAAVPLMRANTGLGKSRNERLLRPPGASMKTDFLSRCIRCGECMKVCPNNSLHPTLDAGRARRAVDAHAGSAHRLLRAELRAVLRSLPHRRHLADHAEGKGLGGGCGRPQNQPVRLGTAFYDRGRCLPWALATDCIVCEEWCPVSPKAFTWKRPR